VLAVLAATLFRPPPSSGPFGRDFEAYYAAGATWNAGGDPWSRDVWRVERTIAGVDASRDEVLPFVGPAASLPLWSLFARMPFAFARNVWLALLALALAVLVLASLHVAGRPIARADAGTALLFGAVAAPALDDLALGQAALASAAAVAVAFVALRRGAPWAIGAAWVAAIQPNLALPLAAYLTTRRAALVLLLAGATLLAITFAAGGGPAGALAYAHRLAEHGASERFSLIQYGVPAILATFGIALGTATLAGAALGALALGAATAAAYRFRLQPAYTAAIAVALLPWIVPFFHEHDFAIVLLPAIVLAASPSPRLRALAGIASICVFVDWLGIAQRPFAVAQTVCLACAMTSAYIALCDRTARQPAPLAVPVVCAVLLAVVVPFALAHPAPGWPDALGAFHAPPNLDASAVWAAEQRQSGLDRLEPAWGMLRLLPLAGCALFAFASFVAARSESTR
jgi:hypothetical protein